MTDETSGTSGRTTEDAARLSKVASSFASALDELDKAKTFAKPRYQVEVYRLATELLDSDAGLVELLEQASRFDRAGVFYGGPWAELRELQPALVGACLRGQGSVPTIEALSELRLLALALGRTNDAPISADDARQFLRDIVALNLDLLFPEDSEETRVRPLVMGRAHRLFSLIGNQLSLDGLRKEVTEEILDLAAQQPIVTDRISKLVRLAHKLPAENHDEGDSKVLAPFHAAVHGPTTLSREHPDPADYRDAIADASAEELEREAAEFAESLRATALPHALHTVLLRKLARQNPAAVSAALGLSPVGAAELEANFEFAKALIKVALLPHTANAVFGFAKLLERGLLSRPEVSGGLRRLIELDVGTNARRILLSNIPKNAGLTANAVLVAGAISVLGQPLGVGQGANPTCQAARGISLWGTHAPGMLLDMVAHATRDGLVESEFEGIRFRSNEVGGGVIAPLDTSLDPLQLVLVPHLDRIYEEMLSRASLRGDDAHKWVNPAMYGRWVPRGFISAVDPTGRVVDYGGFVRRFYATHHPSFNDGHELIYPNPVGLLVTDVRGKLLGPHAVSIQRIGQGPAGKLRVYFFNPNNDGRQRWGGDVTPTVRGHGEEPGESSLPFHHFTARLYAFHYNPYEEGDAYAVPQSIVDELESMARASWGESYKWE